MILYIPKDPSNIRKVSLGSIKFLAKQLKDFVETYEKNILINTEEDLKNFEQLKYISKLLNAGEYDKLIEYPQLFIDFDDDNEEYIPEYYPYY